MNPNFQNSNLLDAPIFLAVTSGGAGKYSRLIADLIESRPNVSGGSRSEPASPSSSKSPLDERLAERLLSFKRMISPVSRYLDQSWRTELLETLDRLFDLEDWDTNFAIPDPYSFATFLRLIIHLHPTKRPGLGMSARGHILASWSRGRDRIVIECLPNDELRWVLSQSIEGCRESAAGKNRIHRLIDLIEGYEPDRFFKDGDKIIS
jgi:hypothetical protein